ncbi:MAG: MFS transporter [Chloroflexi bacterium]|nr:MFS transporter [Chloroflexota bacterium]
MQAAITQTTNVRRDRLAWYLFDFGNSAYAAVVLLAVYSAYFQNSVVGGSRGTQLWGFSVGIAMLVVAITSPVLGAIADFSGAKKRFLMFFTTLCITFTALLFFVGEGMILFGMLFFILAEIGYRSGQVFYNSLLPEIADEDEMPHVSGMGWAIGSFGGILCLLIVLPLIVLIGGTFIVRSSFVITALFFALATGPLFLWMSERAQPQKLPKGQNHLTIGFKRLWATAKKARHYREFIKFMIAFIIFNDGIIMALDFSAIIGAVMFGLAQEQLIILMIIVQVTSVIGALAFGVTAERWGSKTTIVVSLLLMIGAIVILYFNYSVMGFFAIAALAGFALTGVQSVSRTMVGQLSPKGQSAEFYGLYAISGRASSFVGPTVFGILVLSLERFYRDGGEGFSLAERLAHRNALWSIVAFLAAGLILLLTVNVEKGRQAARAIVTDLDDLEPAEDLAGA